MSNSTFDAENVPLTDDMGLVRQRFEDAFDALYEEMKKAPSFLESTGAGLVNIKLPDGRYCQVKLTFTTDEEEFNGNLDFLDGEDA